MLNFSGALIVYTVEMLIAYIVFSYIAVRRYCAPIVFLIGSILFTSGALVNMLFSNSPWVNVGYTFLINFSFSSICFHLNFRSAVIYSL